jgi:hypothetical protein
MAWNKPVLSEMIAEVGWDDETQELLVTFLKKGRTAAYKGFEESDADRLSRAGSVGGMFLSEIKPFATDWRYI